MEEHEGSVDCLQKNLSKNEIGNHQSIMHFRFFTMPLGLVVLLCTI